MSTQLTYLEGGIIADEEHHIYVVRSSAVERLIVAQEDAGSNPVAPPINLRSYQLEALESFREPARGLFAGRRSGRSLAVAQLVERWSETPRVTGSIPVRETKRKHKV